MGFRGVGKVGGTIFGQIPMEQATPTSRMAGRLRPAREYVSPMITLRHPATFFPRLPTCPARGASFFLPWKWG